MQSFRGKVGFRECERKSVQVFRKKSIALDVEHTAVGRDVELVRAVIGAALELEEAGGTALLEVGLLEDKAGNLGFGGGKDIRRDFVFRNIVVEIVAVIGIAGRDGAWLSGTGTEQGQ